MNKNEAQAALESLAAQGLMKNNGDGTFSTTELGRLVATTGEDPQSKQKEN